MMRAYEKPEARWLEIDLFDILTASTTFPEAEIEGEDLPVIWRQP